MKTFATILAATAALALSAFGQAFTPTAKTIKIDKLSPSVNSSPEYSIKYTTDKRTEYLKWLEIEVEFSVDLPGNVDTIDELTFEYLVEVNGKLCPGEITHVNIPKGKHYSVMYMSPRSIDRLTAGKPLNQGTIGNIWVKVTKQGALLTQKSDKAGVPDPKKQRMAGLLVPKSETPFHVLWWDRYEAVKAGSGSR